MLCDIGAHVGRFGASHVDGVPYVINGNSGKSPASAPDEGGFIGWSTFGVNQPSDVDIRDRNKGPYDDGPSDWFAVETHAQIDQMTITAPDSVAAGTASQVSASFTQQARTVPVGYPVSADWSDSEGVYIGTEEPTSTRFKAWYNPASGVFTAIRPGTVTLSVTVNSVTASATIVVTG